MWQDQDGERSSQQELILSEASWVYLGGAPSYSKSRRELCILLFPQQIFPACPLCDEHRAYAWALNTKQTLSPGCPCQGSPQLRPTGLLLTGYLNRICSVVGFNMTHFECLLLSDLNKDLTTKPTCLNLKNSELCKAKAAFRKNETTDRMLHIYSVFNAATNTNYSIQTMYLLLFMTNFVSLKKDTQINHWLYCFMQCISMHSVIVNCWINHKLNFQSWCYLYHIRTHHTPAPCTKTVVAKAFSETCYNKKIRKNSHFPYTLQTGIY